MLMVQILDKMSTIFNSLYITYHVIYSDGTTVVAYNRQVSRGSCIDAGNENGCSFNTFPSANLNIFILNRVYPSTSIIFIEIKR